MGYYDDLKSDNWALKRLVIIERDEFKCKKCDLERPALRGIVKSFGILTYTELIAKGSSFNLGQLPVNYDNLNYTGDRSRKFELKDLRFSLLYREEKVFGILKKFHRLVCFYPDTFSRENVSDLNVHHKYYISGRKPWEYDNDALVTLCVKCHKEEHEKSEVIVYSEDGGELYKTAICRKCGGSGYLHEYDYYYAGICFECGGEGSLLLDENIILDDDSDELPF